MKWFVIFISLVVALWVRGEAVAAESIEARVSAVLYAPVNGSQQIEVRLHDDSDANKALKAAIESRLTAKGFALTKGAPMILTFESSSTIGDGRPEEAPTRFELRAGSGTAGKDDYSAKYKLFTTKSGSDVAPGAAYGGDVRLELAINNRANGRRLWQGWAVADSTGRESTATASAMIEPLVASIGKTLRAQAVNAVIP